MAQTLHFMTAATATESTAATVRSVEEAKAVLLWRSGKNGNGVHSSEVRE